MRNKFDFLHEHEHQSFWQADNNIFGDRSRACPTYPKVQVCKISRKKWVVKLIFCMLVNINLFYKLMISFLMGLARHERKKKLGIKSIFLHDVNIKVFNKLIFHYSCDGWSQSYAKYSKWQVCNILEMTC